MVQLGASAIARNVSNVLVFAVIDGAASSHADLGDCTDGTAGAQSRAADRTTSFWHARASVWIATSFRPCPRMHEYANAWLLVVAGKTLFKNLLKRKTRSHETAFRVSKFFF
jgi:hypothetical protein